MPLTLVRTTSLSEACEYPFDSKSEIFLSWAEWSAKLPTDIFFEKNGVLLRVNQCSFCENSFLRLNTVLFTHMKLFSRVWLEVKIFPSQSCLLDWAVLWGSDPPFAFGVAMKICYQLTCYSQNLEEWYEKIVVEKRVFEIKDNLIVKKN